MECKYLAFFVPESQTNDRDIAKMVDIVRRLNDRPENARVL
jgi:hypothetical protein